MDYPANQFPKTCACCRRAFYWYDWELLPVLSKEGVPPRTDLELKNCSCGSTLAVLLAEDES